MNREPAGRVPAATAGQQKKGPLDEIDPGGRAQWRQWLAEHHGNSPGVWLILRKKHAGQPLTLDEAVREALCFGWIDSTLRPVDGEKSALKFTPRRPGSIWSRSNKERVESLIAAGLMTEAGQKAIDAAKNDGSWIALDAVEALRVPDDLEKALAADPRARQNFEAFTPSVRKNALWWIESAKRPRTRAERVAETVRLAALNLPVTSRTRRRPLRHDSAATVCAVFPAQGSVRRRLG